MLAKLELLDRTALAQWQGEPAEASRVALAQSRQPRRPFLAPLAWLEGWAGCVAIAGGTIALGALFFVALDATANPSGVGVTGCDRSAAADAVLGRVADAEGAQRRGSDGRGACHSLAL